jgi:hypothetical protein
MNQSNRQWKIGSSCKGLPNESDDSDDEDYKPSKTKFEFSDLFTDRVTRSATATQRAEIWKLKHGKREEAKCMLCTTIVTKKTCGYDHVIPYSKGGRTLISNLQILCNQCK